MSTTPSVHGFLEDARVPYSVVPHKAAYTARDEAAAVHVPARDWAKVVICFVDGQPIQAVVPAALTVDLKSLLELTGGEHIRLAREDELGHLFPDCEPGAMPPLGPMYGQRVFVDVALALEPDIAFSAGSHTDAIRIRWSDFARSVKPIVGRFADRT